MSPESMSDFELIALISCVDVTNVLGSFECLHHGIQFPTSHQPNKVSNKQTSTTSYVTSDAA